MTLLRIVISDLIYLSKDLSIWYEMKSRSDHGTDIAVANMDHLEISILEETIEMIDWSKYNGNNGVEIDRINSDTGKPEYILQVPSTSQSIRVVQWYSLVILEHLLILHKQGRTSPTYTTCMIIEELDPTNYFSCMGSDPDLFITNLIEMEDFRILLIPLRQIFLSSASNVASSCYLLNVASRILIQIQSDWCRSRAPNLAFLEEVALLIAYGVRNCLDYLPTTQDSLNIGGLINDTSSNTIENMIQLLSNLIYRPPNVPCSLSSCDVTLRIHHMCYEILLESLPHILRVSSIQNRSVEPNYHVHTATTLSAAILRTILAVQCGISVATSLWHGEYVRPLFQLLDDPILSDIIVFILSGIVLEIKHGKSIVVDIDDVLKSLSPESLPIRTEPDPNTVMQVELHVGSKRQPVQQSTEDEYPQKRRRSGTMVQLDAVHYVFSLHDVLLRCFDKNNNDVISRLKTDLKTSDALFTESWLNDLLYLTRRFHLLLLFVQYEPSEAWLTLLTCAPNLFRFVNDSLSVISNISSRLMQLEDRRHNSTADSNIALLVKRVVVCGIFIAKCVWLDSSGIDVVPGVLQTILALANRWEIHPNCYEGSDAISSFEVPLCLHDVLFAFSRCRFGGATIVDSPQPACVLNVELFIMLSATINVRRLDRLIVHWTGPLWSPITENSRQQITRLLTLLRPSYQNQINPTNIEYIQAQSRDELLRARLDHPDPLRRLALWQIGAWVIQSMAPQDLHSWSHRRLEDGSSLGARLLNVLVDTAFLDVNATVLTYTSRELGNVLTRNNWISVLALLSTDEEWKHIKSGGLTSKGEINGVISRLFINIEDMLKIHGSHTKQLENEFIIDKALTKEIEIFHKSSSRTICSLCFAQPHSENESINTANKYSIVLASREWSRFYRSAPRRIELEGFYFASLLRVAHCTAAGSVVLSEMWSSIAPIIVRELFTTNSNEHLNKPDRGDRASPSWKLRQFSAFSSFIYAVMTGKIGGESHFSTSVEADLEKFVDSSLPSTIADLVVDKNYVGLQMMASYKLCVLGQKRSLTKLLKRMEPLSFHCDPISGFVVGCVSKTSTTRLWNYDLENHTRQLCLAPGLVEQIIPHIFMRSGRDELIFFTNIVLQEKISLKQLVTSREMLTLKNFVLELGRNPEHLEPMLIALKKAAIIRSDSYNISSDSSLDNTTCINDDSVKSWVTQNFMFLLVNVVQYKWSTKTVTQQVASLTSLVTILSFLKSEESSQYLPQIMATVTTALSDTPSTVHPFKDQHKLLRQLAVQVLSKFVMSMAQSYLEVVGQNLTSVVVSLIPTLTNSGNKEKDVLCEEERHAVALLEWLSSQESLHQYFEEIPFLPSTTSLDAVRARLKARGLNFDHLLSVSTETTQDGTNGTRSVTSDVGSTGGDSRGAASNAARQAALRRRLEMVSPLLENDSASVRGVALQHLTSLLRSNRELFHSLIENEGTTSLKKFVTVLYRDNNGTLVIHRLPVCDKSSKLLLFSGKSRWNITDFIHVLLSRCLKETDQNARTLLATCFGEVGAINANLLEETKATNESHSRKTSIPPWYSAPHLLGLQLVTTYLVAALKSATSSSDQHKIAFAVQQLLALLNEAGKSGRIAGTPTQNEAPLRNVGPPTTFFAGNTSKPKMHESLIHTLVDAGVIDVVEPFWFSEFHEVSTVFAFILFPPISDLTNILLQG